MEKFDINKEMAKLKGLNIIEKCSALDDLLDDLEDAQPSMAIFHMLKNMVIKSCMTTCPFT